MKKGLKEKKHWQEMTFYELCAAYNLTPSEANILTILAKNPDSNDNRVVGLLALLRSSTIGIGQAILRVGSPGKKEKKLAEFFLRSQGYNKNGKRIRKKKQ